MTKIIKNLPRRHFIRQASCAALGGTTFLSTLLNLRTVGASSVFNSAVNAGGEYKAIVCLLFSGGNDAFNMLVPTNTDEYNHYATSRSNLAIPVNDLLPLNATNTGSRNFGLHPSMVRSAELFNNGDLSFIANVGSLIEPINKTQFYNDTVPTPLGLYSHSDQVMHWQTGIPHDRVATGWGGKIADMLNECNNNDAISMCLSLSGTNVWQTGNEATEFAIHPTNGAVGLNSDGMYINPLVKTAVDNMLDANYNDLFMNGYKNVTRTSRIGGEQLQAALDMAPTFNTPFTNNYLSNSMQMVARAINAQATLGMNRQIFFIDYGGWDNHDGLITNHANLLSEVDNALYEFNQAMNQLGVADKVTTFGLSEFGRTLSSNGDGSDHGWGGNIFTMGGAVNGAAIYGDYPNLEMGSELEVGGGVFIPTTSADEYFAEIAMWFGVPISELTTLFPNLGNFYTPGPDNPIGFLNI